MPSKPVVSYEKIVAVVKGLPIFVCDNKLKKENDEVWEKACYI